MRLAYRTKRHSPQGYVAVTKPLARELYNNGVAVTLCGNNVNSFHVFGGWSLGYTISNKDGKPFDEYHNAMLFYLDRELGYYLVYYVKREDV